MTRRTTSCIFIGLLCLFSLSATVLNVGNDTWSMGLSENEDDLLTWSTGMEQDIGSNGVIVLSLLSFTNRGLGKGESFVNDRYDLLKVSGGFIWQFAVSPFRFSARSTFGLEITGNMGGAVLQNLLHKLMRIPEVVLPYPGEMSFVPSLDQNATFEWNMTDEFSLSGSADVSFGRFRSLKSEAGLKIGLRDVSGMIGLDWISVKALKGWEMKATEDLYAERVSGPGFLFGYDLGFVGFRYRVNLKTLRGYGVFSFRPDALSEKKYEKTVLTLKLADTWFIGNKFQQTTVTWRFSEHFSAVFSSSFSSGYPAKGYLTTSEYRIRRNYGLWELGILYRYDFRYFDLYSGLTAGVSRWVIDRIYNNNPYALEETERLGDSWFPVFTTFIGTAFAPEGFLVLGPCTVRPDVSVGFRWLPEQIRETLAGDTMHNGWNKWFMEPVFGLGVEFGF